MIKLKKLIEANVSSIAGKQHKDIIKRLKELNLSDDDIYGVVSAIKYIEDDSWRKGAQEREYGHSDFGGKGRIPSFYRNIKSILKSVKVSASDIKDIIGRAETLAYAAERKGRKEGFYR
jgi:hypothetical protein